MLWGSDGEKFMSNSPRMFSFFCVHSGFLSWILTVGNSENHKVVVR